MKTLIQKFHLGDKVCSKFTGLPAHGIISGCVFGYLQARQMGARSKEEALKICQSWTDLNPNWIYEIVYFVQLKEPQRNCTFAEYKKNPENEFKEFQDYEREVPKKDIIAFIQEDLEKIDETYSSHEQ